MKVSIKELLEAIERNEYNMGGDVDTLLMLYRHCVAELITGKENEWSEEIKEKVRASLLKDVKLEF